MRKLVVFAVIMGFAVAAQAQCYEGNIKKADAAYRNGKYSEAKKLYETALQCSDIVRFANGKEAKEGIRRCREKMENKVVAVKDFVVNVDGVQFKMVFVKGGTFKMGCTDEQGEDCADVERPAHSVTLSSYYIGETEVTQALWKAVMGVAPENGGAYPVVVEFEEVQDFIMRLNQKTGRTFRLPTEAEWEYAARGGSKSKGYKYSGSNTVREVSWHASIDENIHPVKQKKPNELGLYDMSGNVWEWCSDLYGEYSEEAQTNPQGPIEVSGDEDYESGQEHVIRGGGVDSFAWSSRVCQRGSESSSRGVIGFRLAIDL